MTSFRYVELSDETLEEGAKKGGNKLQNKPQKSFQREPLKNEIIYFIWDSINKNKRNQASFNWTILVSLNAKLFLWLQNSRKVFPKSVFKTFLGRKYVKTSKNHQMPILHMIALEPQQWRSVSLEPLKINNSMAF